MFELSPLFVCPLGLLLELDPLVLLYKYQLLSFQPSILIRVLPALYGFQCARGMGLLLCWGGILAPFNNKGLKILKQNSRIVGLDIKVFRFYRMTQVMFESIAIFMSNLVAIFQGSSVFILVLFNFAIVKLHKFIPPPLYLFVVCSDIVILSALYLFMPFVSYPYNCSLGIKRGWEMAMVQYPGRKKLKKKFRATSCLKLYTGIGRHNFFFNDRGVLMMLLQSVVTLSVNFIMFDFTKHFLYF